MRPLVRGRRNRQDSCHHVGLPWFSVLWKTGRKTEPSPLLLPICSVSGGFEMEVELCSFLFTKSTSLLRKAQTKQAQGLYKFNPWADQSRPFGWGCLRGANWQYPLYVQKALKEDSYLESPQPPPSNNSETLLSWDTLILLQSFNLRIQASDFEMKDLFYEVSKTTSPYFINLMFWHQKRTYYLLQNSITGSCLSCNIWHLQPTFQKWTSCLSHGPLLFYNQFTGPWSQDPTFTLWSLTCKELRSQQDTEKWSWLTLCPLTMNMTILEVKFYTNIKLQCIIKLRPSLANNIRKWNNEIKRQLLSPPEVTHT